MGVGTIIMIVILVGLFWFMNRSNKKQERETNEMRNNLEVGDEITTIGGIIGEIVKIKEETVTIETGKDRTKIRILRSAVRSVDVHAYEKRGDGRKPAEPANAENQKPRRKNKNEKNEKNENSQTNQEVVSTSNEAVTDTTSESNEK